MLPMGLWICSLVALSASTWKFGKIEKPCQYCLYLEKNLLLSTKRIHGFILITRNFF